ncbi:TRAP transporter substrate-binding protein [Halalkalibaculum sp. DA3122]|uniref:TRAP transporter substrate-binding protein n=2 Tax=unclassified Halalkalibaculum TaxID=2964617 RepID=UPI00375451EE
MTQTANFYSSNLLLFSMALLLFWGCSRSDTATDRSKTLIMAHAMHLEHPVSKAMAYMDERVEEISDGRLKIEMYPNQQLGSERELLELVQIGTVGMTKISGAALGKIVPAVTIFSLPYLFRNEAHLKAVQNAPIGQEILQRGAEYGLKGLTYYDAGFRSFYTVEKPVREPADLNGMKIRVQESQMAIQTMQALGASPTPLAYGELYTALQSGVVDGAENNPPSFHTARHYEVCNYYSLDQHTSVPDFLVISTNVWIDLTDQEKKWLSQAVEESAARQEVLWDEAVEEAMNIVTEAGVEIIRPDKGPFQEAVQPVYDRYAQQNPELYKMVEQIREIQPDSQQVQSANTQETK